MTQLDSKIPSICNPSAKLLTKILAVPALLLGISALPAAADDNGCNAATLKGDYGFTINGFSPNPDGSQSPNKGVAITHFDGAGKLTQRDFVITAGVPNPGNGNSMTGFVFSTGETGTYSLSPDCTGTMDIVLPAPPGSGLSSGLIKLMLVVTHRGNAIHTVVAEITFPGAPAPTLNTTSSDAWKIGCDHDHD
jgi:hypothetical protein